MSSQIIYSWLNRLDGTYQAKPRNNITLVVSPERYGLNGAAKRGTKWHAQATRWHEPTRTASRFGRDVYLNLQASAKDAMRLAESIYFEEISK